MPESNGLFPAMKGEIITSAKQNNSTVYEYSALLAERLSNVTLTGDPGAVAECVDAITRLRKELGPQEPFEEPEVYKVEKIDNTDWIITCPHCDNGFILHGPTWVQGGNPEEGSRSTRCCPYCAEESYLLDKRLQWQRAKDH